MPISATSQPNLALSRTKTGQRFAVLDSWRGICAVLVVAFHFPLAGPISQSGLVRGAFLFVDFFFVLSGFVFMHAYGARLIKGGELAKFIITRIGRLAPLHLFMLSVLVALDVTRWLIPALGNGHAIFTGRNTLDALLANVVMIHGLGVLDQLTWNAPSWSISVELFAYVLFGCVLVVAKQRAYGVASVVFFVCLAFLQSTPNCMDVTYDFGLIRCLYGFSAGMLVHAAYHYIDSADQLPRVKRQFWTSVELFTVLLIVAFVTSASNTIYSLLAPLVFGLVVLVFAQQGGHVSQLLLAKPFTILGTISYSLYMTHLTVQGCFHAVARFGHINFGWDELTKLETSGSTTYAFSASEDLALLSLMIGLTIFVSTLTYRYVEKPSRDWFRQMAKRFR